MPEDTKNQQEAAVNSVLNSVDKATESRERFFESDHKSNEASVRILEAYAKLAEDKPEEVFGLKPTERDRFMVNNALQPALKALASGNGSGVGTEVDLESGDVTGNNPAVIGLIGELIASGGAPEIVDSLLGHIQSEKTFWKDTAKEGVEGITGLIGQGIDLITGGSQAP